MTELFTGDDVLWVFDVSAWTYRFWVTMQGRCHHGFIDFVGKLLMENEPAHVAACCDLPLPTFRHDIAPGVYKANRSDTDARYLERRRWAKEMLEDVHGVRTFAKPGFEADDLIATVTTRAVEDGLRVVLLGRDKDLMSLVSDRVQMWDVHGKQVFGVPEVCAKFDVRFPAQIRDYLAICGDAADNIPGIPGLGPKAAVELLAAFDTLELAIDHAKARGKKDEFYKRRPRYCEKLVTHEKEALLSLRLVELATAAPITYNRQELRRT